MINIAELLKDCPRGMELDCLMYEDVCFDYVDELNIIHCYTHCQTHTTSLLFDQYGKPSINIKSKCVIFPKGKTTWEGFQRPFKDGDILTTNLGSVFILKEPNEDVLCYNCYVALNDVSRFITSYTKFCIKNGCRLATEEEKQKLFDAIKANGYHWNPETKKLEKLIESKEDTDDGLVMSKEDRHDEIVMSGIYFDREYYADEVELHLGNYEIEVRDGKTYAVFKNQETKISKPNFKVENKIKKKSLDNPIEITSVIPKMYNTFKDGSFQHVEIIDEDYELALDKFDITTLKPFESRVLVRDASCYEWEADIFGRYSDGYITLGGGKWKQCIPYEGNEHLLGTTDDCDEFFKF